MVRRRLPPDILGKWPQQQADEQRRDDEGRNKEDRAQRARGDPDADLTLIKRVEEIEAAPQVLSAPSSSIANTERRRSAPMQARAIIVATRSP
jgi:hypothetical protein